MSVASVFGRYLRRAAPQGRWNGPAHTPIERLPMVAIDCETTGLDPRRDRIVSFAAIRIADGLQVVAPPELDVTIDPGVPIPARAAGIHGIDDSQVTGAPRFGDVAPAISASLSHSVVVGHFVAFDLAILGREARRAGLPWHEPPSFDTASLAAGAGFPPDRIDLVDLLQRLGVEQHGRRHTAAGDARMAADLFVALAHRLMGQGRGTYGGITAAHGLRR